MDEECQECGCLINNENKDRGGCCDFCVKAYTEARNRLLNKHDKLKTKDELKEFIQKSKEEWKELIKSLKDTNIHIELPHKCHSCSAILWFDDNNKKNYIYKKGSYFCNGCK